jgi:hypothetical protein
MSKKKGNLIDQFLDKIILGIAGLAGLYLLWAFVISNPYGKEAGNRKYSPSEIDQSNKKQTEVILYKLQESATPKPYQQNKVAELKQMMDCSIPKVSVAVNWPSTGSGATDVTIEAPIYVIPSIPQLEAVATVSIRGAAKVPTEDVAPDRPYASVASQTADLDMVTFSAKINIPLLVSNFQQSFNGPRLNQKWRNPAYAEPVFARIELQRQAKLPDGSWGEWEKVPVMKIDPYQKTLKDLPLTIEQMTFGDVAMFMNQFRDFAIIRDVLQPEPYQFLSSQAKWLPAQYAIEYRKIVDSEAEKKSREERERKAAEREQNKRTNRPGGGMQGGGGMPGMGGGMPGMGDKPVKPTPVKPVAQTRTTQNIEMDAANAALKVNAKLTSLKEVMVWVHDDTTTPGTTYRYRMRYGVFNPVAGKNWLAEESKNYQNQVVLWSDYTELKDPVAVPKMLHLFPTDVLANNAGAKVEVYKYYLGRWRSETFDVRPGQMIGMSKEWKPTDTTTTGSDLITGAGGDTTVSTTVDFSTGVMLTDIVMTTDWSGPGVRQKIYPEMLYIDAGNKILSMPAKRQSWPKDVTADYNAVKQEMEKSTDTVTPSTMPGMEGKPGMMPGMPGMPGGPGMMPGM